MRSQVLAALLLSPLALATDGANRNLGSVPGPFNKNATMNKYLTVLFSGLYGPDGTKMNASPLKAAPNATLPASMTTMFGAEGLPVLVADSDYATVSVKRNASQPLPARATSMTVFACYAKASLYDRGWRAPNNNTELDKQCPWYIDTLPVEGGNTTWHINPDTPKAIMFLRAYQMCKPAPGADYEEDVVCGFGNSPGVIQVNPIETHPANLIAGAVVCILLGPLCLVGFYVYESKFKKWS